MSAMAELIDMLKTSGGEIMKMTANAEDGTILACVVIAEGGSAKLLADAANEIDKGLDQ